MLTQNKNKIESLNSIMSEAVTKISELEDDVPQNIHPLKFLKDELSKVQKSIQVLNDLIKCPITWVIRLLEGLGEKKSG